MKTHDEFKFAKANFGRSQELGTGSSLFDATGFATTRKRKSATSETIEREREAKGKDSRQIRILFPVTPEEGNIPSSWRNELRGNKTKGESDVANS